MPVQAINLSHHKKKKNQPFFTIKMQKKWRSGKLGFMRVCVDFGKEKAARVCAQTGGRAHSGRPRGRMRLRRIGRCAGRIGNHVVRTARRDLPIAGATIIPRHSSNSCYNALCALRAFGMGVYGYGGKTKIPHRGN